MKELDSSYTRLSHTLICERIAMVMALETGKFVHTNVHYDELVHVLAYHKFSSSLWGKMDVFGWTHFRKYIVQFDFPKTVIWPTSGIYVSPGLA